MVPFYQLCDFNISKKSKNKLENLDWRSLQITTGFSSFSVSKTIIKNWLKRKWSLTSFCKIYGIFLENIVTLHNLKLPFDLEKNLLDEIKVNFSDIELPVIRLQVMYDGNFLPIHIDPSREVSLVIPISDLKGSWTQFYDYHGADGQIIDPGACSLSDQLEILLPTLLNTKIPHAVWSKKRITKDRPRITLTAKWSNVSYSSMVEKLS